MTAANEPRNPDYTYTTSDGQDVGIRVEGPSTHEFTYADGSTLTVEQDAGGNRSYVVSPWPPEAGGQ
ncbi:hypothetical protein [Nocardia sp. CA-290969]|uniref:hypothetical protein n=1 Tax=Nocardia sp. CA-290969 TaxID=3239986 RepID=UPI003D92DF93